MDLRARARALPEKPGVYLFRGDAEKVLYVGKAKALRRRVASYFRPAAQLGARTARLMDQARNLETIVVENEVEAFVLEDTLIKKHAPPFNIQLRDDKSYPYLKLTLADAWPQFTFVRRPKVRDGSLYFGPFPAAAVRGTLRALGRLFPLRTCHGPLEKLARKPCLDYHIGRCAGPCIGAITPEAYRSLAEEGRWFLEGKRAALAKRLEDEMARASAELRYEEAAQARDRLRAVRTVQEGQRVSFAAGGDRDAVALHRERGGGACAAILVVREGNLTARHHFFLEAAESAGLTEAEMLAAFLEQHYARQATAPDEIVIPRAVARREAWDPSFLERLLTEKRGTPVLFRPPKNRAERELLALAARNAAEASAQRSREDDARAATAEASSRALAEALSLPEPPRRIEAFDISNIQGRLPVGSLVVWEDGRMKKSDYRRYAVRTVGQSDDFAMMREVVGRRYRRLREEGAEMPDLILVDGGPGQLSSALAALSEALVEPKAILGLAKREEEIWRPGAREPLRLPRGSPALHILQHIRDEAHRFAITYYRERHRKLVQRSLLDDLPGIGPARRRSLLQNFGGLEALAAASVEALAAAPGMNGAVAARVHAFLREPGNGISPPAATPRS